MPERVSSSLLYLAALTVMSIVVALVAGAALYVETRNQARTQAETMTHGHVAAGRAAISLYGCGSCHVIPGIHGAYGKVGPDLTGIARRVTLAGSLSNDPETMARWLEHPQSLRPGSGMPEQDVSASDARDIAAYLYSKR